MDIRKNLEPLKRGVVILNSTTGGGNGLLCYVNVRDLPGTVFRIIIIAIIRADQIEEGARLVDRMGTHLYNPY